jgi:hypothetical protein
MGIYTNEKVYGIRIMEFSTTYGEGVYKSWLKISLDTFLEIIGIHITT